MDRQTNSQLELFGVISSPSGQTMRRERGSSFNFFHAHEKVILLAIAFVVVGVSSFSLGVEKGKRLLTVKSQQAVLAPRPGASSEILVTKKTELPQASAQLSSGRFTLQLASYKSRVSAEKDVQLLKKKGFSPVLLSKTGFTVLCVGNFNKKEEAVNFFMTQIKKQTRFQEYQIRRLV
jgi:hypothetical protein